jgi:sigma-54 interacting transcriptional regulator
LLSAIDQAINRGRQIVQLKNRPTQKKSYSEDDLCGEISFSEMVGKSAALRRVLQQVETVAPSDSTVLILGETGTGKELIAAQFTSAAGGETNPWSGSIAPLSRRNCLKVNSSATREAHSPALSKIGPAVSRPPRVEPCSWTRSVKSLWNYRANCCAFFRRNLTNVSERKNPVRGCANRCGHESGSEETSSRRPLSRRPLLPSKCFPVESCRPQGTQGRHPSSGNTLRRIVGERTRLSQTETNPSGHRSAPRLRLAR